ncbi:MAG: hypothetical protein ACHQ53_07955, partial [Polyangiales bacterium]
MTKQLAVGGFLILVVAGCGASGGNKSGTGTGGTSAAFGTGGIAPAPANGGITPAATGGKSGGATGGTIAPFTGGTGAAGMMATAGTSGGSSGNGGTSGNGGMSSPDSGMADGGPKGMGTCCPSGDCLCHGDPPSAVTHAAGPFKTMNYALAGAGCVFYPTDATPPFAAVSVSDGFLGTGGCGPTAQTGEWGPLYASWGIVAMIIDTGASDDPPTRGMKLTAAIAAFKTE